VVVFNQRTKLGTLIAREPDGRNPCANGVMVQRVGSAGSRSRRRPPGVPAERLSTHSVAPYVSFAEIYDFLIGAPALPLLQEAFRRSVRRFHLDFHSLADVGCGTGGFLTTLACRPVALFGVDRSAAMLAVARHHLASCAVTLLQQDIRRLSLPTRVDLITCNNQTINYLTVPRELVRAFSAIARNLRRGGAFLFDFFARATGMSRTKAKRVRETIRLPDHDIRFEGVVDLSRGASTVRICVANRREPRRCGLEVHRQRWFKPATIEHCLYISGLRVVCMRPVYGSDHSWLHVVAKRI
jgi:SAM-dependent methyltransferase